MIEPKRFTVAVDLDGVLNLYVGWDVDQEWAPPREGAREFTRALLDRGYDVAIFTTRDVVGAHDWLIKNDVPFSYVTNVKPKALVYLDDRAMHFDGSFDGLVERIAAFKPHWQR